jgi:hypothetical protein
MKPPLAFADKRYKSAYSLLSFPASLDWLKG